MPQNSGALRVFPVLEIDNYNTNSKAWANIQTLTRGSTLVDIGNMLDVIWELSKNVTASVSPSNHPMYYAFQDATNVLEIINMPIPYVNNNSLASLFNYFLSVNSALRLERLTFRWKDPSEQTMANDAVMSTVNTTANYTFNLRLDKMGFLGNSTGQYFVTNQETWDAYRKAIVDKNYLEVIKYQIHREWHPYGHAAAAETLSTLPPVYSHHSGQTYTVTFAGICGSARDDAISDLTPEEIAVATERGWTVSIV